MSGVSVNGSLDLAEIPDLADRVASEEPPPATSRKAREERAGTEHPTMSDAIWFSQGYRYLRLRLEAGRLILEETERYGEADEQWTDVSGDEQRSRFIRQAWLDNIAAATSGGTAGAELAASLAYAEIPALADRVASEELECEGALRAETIAHAELLELVAVRLGPARLALASRIPILEADTSGRDGLNPVRQRDFSQHRGVCLADTFGHEKDETGNRGKCDGSRLYLLTDARWLEVTRTGTFSHWQGEWDRWEGAERLMQPSEVAEEYVAAEILDAIATKLRQQLEGGKRAITKRALERAEKARAVATLLGGGK
jgi:hypothetical protein